jgi:DNA-binding CsgD family transcriptional regulator
MTALTADAFALWDEMADFDAAHSDLALEHLMRRLCQRVAGHNALCLGAVRLPDLMPADPLHGWRIGLQRHLQPVPTFADPVRRVIHHAEAGEATSSAARNIALAGHWRVNRLIDLVGADWFESAFYRDFYLAGGLGDAIWGVCPVNEDAEVYLGLFRPAAGPRFSATERDAVADLLRGLKWYFRQLLLSHGLCLANAPLTPTEREVLQRLLAGDSERRIASELGQSVHTSHAHIKRLYRKFGVNNRPALTALWLGHNA